MNWPPHEPWPLSVLIDGHPAVYDESWAMYSDGISIRYATIEGMRKRVLIKKSAFLRCMREAKNKEQEGTK